VQNPRVNPCWILLPGLDGSGRLFAPFLACLGDVDAVVIRYPDDPRLDLDAYARHAVSAIGDARRCIVVAESFSGAVALRMQRLEPRIEALVLVASFVRCPHPLLHAMPLSIVAALARYLAFRSLLRMYCLGRDARRECVDEIRAIVRALPADVLRERLMLIHSTDESAALRAIRVPVLHLRARHDRLVCTSLRADAPPAAFFREVDIDGPHFLLQTRPRACREAIAVWMAASGIVRA